MRKIKKDENEYCINCDDERCGDKTKLCEYLEGIGAAQKCKIFDCQLDHILDGGSHFSNDMRCTECINAEIK